MKNVGTLLMLAVLALATSQARAALLLWDFDSTTSLASGNTRINTSGYTSGATSYNVNQQSSTLFTSSSHLTATAATGGNLAAATGDPTTALQFNAQNGGSTINSATMTLTFTLAAGASLSSGSFILNYNYLASKNSGGTMTWALDVNGTQVGASQTVSMAANTSWNSSGNLTFAGITAGSGATITLVETFSGLANNNNVSFDNLAITSPSIVPEPIAYAMPLFGLVFVGGTAGRFYLARRRQV